MKFRRKTTKARTFNSKLRTKSTKNCKKTTKIRIKSTKSRKKTTKIRTKITKLRINNTKFIMQKIKNEHKLHIGSIIEQLMHKKQLTSEKLGKLIGRTNRAVYKMLEKEHIHVSLMKKISLALDFDLFQLYFEKGQNTNELEKQNRELHQEVDRLKKENASLNEVVEMLKKKLN